MAGTPDDQPGFDTAGWKTDFSNRSVPLSEFRSGGPPRDGIPPIDEPKFVSQREADEDLGPREPVLVVEEGGRARAYPVQILVRPSVERALLFEGETDGRLPPKERVAAVFGERETLVAPFSRLFKRPCSMRS